jgi:hypothetical protein
VLGLERTSHAGRPKSQSNAPRGRGGCIFQIAAFLAFSKRSAQRTVLNRDIECVGMLSHLQNVPPDTTLNGDVGADK